MSDQVSFEELLGKAPQWHTLANCRGVDPELFYPKRGQPTEPAVAVCRACVVREACLEYALRRREEYGIWGGAPARLRRKLRKDRGYCDPAATEVALRAAATRRAKAEAQVA